jgi:hypothetical protein
MPLLLLKLSSPFNPVDAVDLLGKFGESSHKPPGLDGRVWSNTTFELGESDQYVIISFALILMTKDSSTVIECIQELYNDKRINCQVACR